MLGAHYNELIDYCTTSWNLRFRRHFRVPVYFKSRILVAKIQIFTGWKIFVIPISLMKLYSAAYLNCEAIQLYITLKLIATLFKTRF